MPPENPPLRVINIISRLSVGGAVFAAMTVAYEMRRAGLTSTLVTGLIAANEEDMSHVVTSRGMEPRIIPEMGREISLKDVVTAWKLYRLFVELRPDIVGTHSAKAGAVGRLGAFLYRWATPGSLIGRPRPCRIVHTYHGHVFHSYYGRLKTAMFLSIERWLARVTDRIVVVSAQQLVEIQQTFGVGKASQFVLIPYGIDTEAFASPDLRRERARASLGLTGDETVVGIVGRLTEVKNLRLFLDSAALYKKMRPDESVHFLIVGDGHLRQDLETHAVKLELESLTFAGSRDDPPDFYAAMDVVALTSLNEGSPFALLEGMATGLPVIATAVGGVVDTLGALDTRYQATNEGYVVCERGVSVPSSDAVAFSAGLSRLIDDRQLRTELSVRGQAWVREKFSTERMASDVLSLYRELMHEQVKTQRPA
ncbi:MAG TPA: glycosyltransferase [Thermoanaerobaculia bacterium]|nr:glycosyltransferase [Thermoanaerobaculia bacterium]